MTASRAFAEEPALDLRWRGVALSDLPGDELALIAAAVRRDNPARLDEVLSVAWLERSVDVEVSTRTSSELLSAPRHLLQIVGRSPRFAPGRGLGVVLVEAQLPLDEVSDEPVLRIVREAPWSSLSLEIRASLPDRTVVLLDPDFGFTRVYPSGVGAIDLVRRPGYLASLTPATELGRVSRESSLMRAPGWNHGNPYIPFEIPYIGERSQRRWYVETRVAFHIWQGRRFSRGFNSYGCITLREADLAELAAFVFASPTPLSLTVRATPFAEHHHPFPYENDHYWLLENLGSAARPIITRGRFYAIKKMSGPPPAVSEMVSIFMDGERRRDPLGPVAAMPVVPASLVP